MSRTFNSSRPCAWVQPRQSLHASERYMRFGKVQPMQEKRGLLARLFGGSGNG
jgi:hypothetical protein